jgi:hypothetical protein
VNEGVCNRFCDLVALRLRGERVPAKDAFLQIKLSYVLAETAPEEDSQADLMADFGSALRAVSHTRPTMDAPRVIVREEPQVIPIRIE